MNEQYSIKEEFEDLRMEIYNDKPLRKVVFELEIFEDGDYSLVCEGNDTGGYGKNFVKDILPKLTYYKSVFLDYIKELDNEVK